ncbi:rho/rac/cdc gtpase-activating protein [Anaeramoeba flamelloides]|uniref:Rho/rac/cdc gtpase-activating protein n=1 Tax=Anaeramoeba flamelloides TaxID=1746091 RepID=A0AAV8AJW4_9EUKA|nr:rho/rac/cdc gtpase-activating protein [Anaeramoeba flamelloides]
MLPHQSSYTLLGVPVISGFTSRRTNKTENWTRLFSIIKDNHIYLFKSRRDKKPEEEISLFGAEAERDRSGKLNKDFVVSLKPHPSLLDQDHLDLIYYFATDSEASITDWLVSFNQEIEAAESESKIFGTNIQVACSKRTDGLLVPEIVEQTIEVLLDPELHYLEIEGFCQMAGDTQQMESIKNRIDYGMVVDFSAIQDPHVIVGVLKLYFEKLKDPLLPIELYEEFEKCLKIPNNDNKLIAIKETLKKLPDENYDTSKYLFDFLVRVSALCEINKMDATKLSVIFGPSLIRRDNTSSTENIESTSFQEELIRILILNYENLLLNDLDNEEFDQNNFQSKSGIKTRVIAIHPYTAQGKYQISFTKGQIITVLKKDKSGWWYGEIDEETKGIFPSNYTKEITRLGQFNNISQETEYVSELTIDSARKSNQELSQKLNSFKQKSGVEGRNALEELLIEVLYEMKMLKIQLALERSERIKLEEKFIDMNKN